MGIEIAKTNLYVVSGPPPGSVLVAKTNLYVIDNGAPEGPTANVRSDKAAAEAMVFGVSSIQADQVSSAVAFTFPSSEFQADKLSSEALTIRPTDLHTDKVSLQVVCRGRSELAYVRAWTATLDGHDYYFLQLQEMTLVYDLHSEQWYNWGSADRELWRAQIGIDWNANLGNIQSGISALDMSTILVGDYADGTLYFLHTGLLEDDGPDPGEIIPFHREVYGQIPLRGHDYVNCFGVELSGSIGESSLISDLSVKLEYSDDSGHNYFDAGSVNVPAGDRQFVVQWGSLGSFKGPGRLFKIEDWGALYRIDGIDLDDGEKS